MDEKKTSVNEVQKYYQNVNLPIVIPKVNLIMEDFLFCAAILLGGLSLASLLNYINVFLAILVLIFSTYLGIWSIIFCRKKRNDEITERGFCRVAIIRRYLMYKFGADRLRGR